MTLTLRTRTARDRLAWRCSDRPKAGIAEMHRGFAAFRATGGMPFAMFWYYLACGLGRSGRPQENFKWWRTDLLPSRRPGPWLHHVKGELLLVQSPSDVAEAERCFRTAIEIAQRQSARSAELPATTSLARLLAKQGRCDEARAMLATIYGWFTEGFDTADLKDAKALLDELSG
jgi:hypothetical protein